MNEQIIQDFLKWMNANKIDHVIPFLVMMDGKDPKIPHWTDGKKLYTDFELIKMYNRNKK